MKIFTVLCATLLVGGNTFASDLFELNKTQLNPNIQPKIQASLSSTFLSFRVPVKAHGGTISISGPNGYHHTATFEGSNYSLGLLESKSLKGTNHRLPAGRYHYQIDTHVGPLKLVTDTMNNGRGDNSSTYAGTPLRESGSFVIKGGSIQQFNQIQEPTSVRW